MPTSFLERAIAGFDSFVLAGDRIFWFGSPSQSHVGGNRVVQKIGGRRTYFPLSHGTPISDLEALDFFDERADVEKEKRAWVLDNIQRDSSSMLDYVSRYKLLRFVVDELLPRMVAAPLEERLDAIISGGKETITGEQIVQQELGTQIKGSVIDIEVHQHNLGRLERQLAEPLTQGQEYFPADGISDAFRASTVGKPSIFSQLSKNTPILVIGGKVYICGREPAESSLEIVVNGMIMGYDPAPKYSKGILRAYDEAIAGAIKLEAFSELKEAVSRLEKIFLSDVEYMPLMDLDEFMFRDVGFFRNGETYHVFRRIPKFARQTVYDENLFIAKESDKDGFAGELGIALYYKGGQIGYSNLAPVVYRGPIKEDAPFSGRVTIIDPVMRAKFGQLTTICHVGGYPSFPMTADGFVAFITYATSNFLDSFRSRFVEQHHDAAEQAALLEKGVLLTKEAALAKGYMLANIHHIEGDKNR